MITREEKLELLNFETGRAAACAMLTGDPEWTRRLEILKSIKSDVEQKEEDEI